MGKGWTNSVLKIKKLSWKERWVFATKVGIDAKTNEHVVVIGEEGAAICVGTVPRRPASDRWNVDAVNAKQVSPRVPNPENLRHAKSDARTSDEEN